MEAANVSKHTIFESGYFSFNSSDAINAALWVPLNPDDSPIYKISSPDFKIGSKYSSKDIEFTYVVVDLSPFLTLS